MSKSNITISINYNPDSGQSMSDKQAGTYYDSLLGIAGVTMKKRLDFQITNSLAVINVIQNHKPTDNINWRFLVRGRRFMVDSKKSIPLALTAHFPALRK